MKFTYQGYQELIELLHKERYVITNYHEYEQCGNEPCVILRHDMDSSVEMAYEFASMEQKLGIKSTYFALLSGTRFANIFSLLASSTSFIAIGFTMENAGRGGKELGEGTLMR